MQQLAQIRNAADPQNNPTDFGTYFGRCHLCNGRAGNDAAPVEKKTIKIPFSTYLQDTTRLAHTLQENFGFSNLSCDEYFVLHDKKDTDTVLRLSCTDSETNNDVTIVSYPPLHTPFKEVTTYLG